jgi:hypothetical protein
MRDLHELDQWRETGGNVLRVFGGSIGDHGCGAFLIPSKIDGQAMQCVASSGNGWDHVSVSRTSRTPNWTEMEQVKRLFFREDETAMQLHVPAAAHISIHPYCLHLWRSQTQPIPLPPEWMV